jgi:hypothetical protein
VEGKGTYIHSSEYMILFTNLVIRDLRNPRKKRVYEGVSKSFRNGRLERELQMVQLYATRYSCIAILWVSIVSFAAITLFVASQRVFIILFISLRLSPETFGYTLVCMYRWVEGSMLEVTTRITLYCSSTTCHETFYCISQTILIWWIFNDKR